MRDNVSELARFIWDDKPDDFSEMEEGRRTIEKIFLLAPGLLSEGRTFGEVRREMEGRLPDAHSLSLEIIPEDKPFHVSPDDRIVRKGELITIDCALRLRKLWADRSVTLAVGEVDEKRRMLLKTARKAFLLVKEACLPGTPFCRIAGELGSFLADSPCCLVPGCGGHGIGASLHQGEDYIYSNPGKHQVMPEKGAFTVEPVLSYSDGKGTLYAYYEDTIIRS